MRNLIFLLAFLLLTQTCHATGSVRGVLVDTSNEPIRNAWVTLFGEAEMLARSLTDENGRFVLRNVPQGSYHIMIRFPKFYRVLYFVPVEPGKSLRLRIDPEKENEVPLMHPEFSGKPIDMERFDLNKVPMTDGFDFPVGKGEAKGYYIARKFGTKNHLGEDWNGVGGGDSDLGDDILTIANGLIIYAGDEGPGWGKVVRIIHNTGTYKEPRFVESVYAHLNKVHVVEGQKVYRCGKIGTMGNASGMYKAHLHLELRNAIGEPIGGGYNENREGFLDPSAFIKANRPWWRIYKE